MKSRLMGSLVAGCCLSTATAAMAGSFEREWSGWGVSFDANGGNGVIADSAGRGTFGHASERTVLESTFTGSCDATGIELTNTLATSVVRFANGDLLFRTISGGQPSLTCFDPSTLTARTTIHLEIRGGTGRFRNATGYVTQEWEVTILDGINGAVGREVGEIFGVGGPAKR